MTVTVDGQVDPVQRIQAIEAEKLVLQRRLEIVARHLLDEANSRGFCSEYDDFVEMVNAECGAQVLLSRRREYSVWFSGAMTIVALCDDDAAEACSRELYAVGGRISYPWTFDVGDVEVV